MRTRGRVVGAFDASGDIGRANDRTQICCISAAAGALIEDVLGPWTKQVNEALKGSLQVKLFPGGTLGRDPVQQYKLVRDRVVDIAYVVTGYTPGDFPDSTIFELPFLVESSLEGSLAHWRMHERGLVRGYDRVKPLGLFSIPPQSIHANFKLTKIDDLKGQKIRSAGPYQSAAIELLGGTPVSGIPVSQAAEALSRGVRPAPPSALPPWRFPR